MKVLVACEESQAVCKAFRARGHEAYSCDIQPCSGGHPEWHIRGDIFMVLNDGWDMLIGHPPCTYLTVTGNAWFNVKKYGADAVKRIKNRFEACNFFLDLLNAPVEYICLENPVGYMNSIIKPAQIIQPYFFGDEAQKTTCLWLKGLPPLVHQKENGLFGSSTHVGKGEMVTFDSGPVMPKWYAEAWKLPKAERAKIRSKTFPGIANAMAEQWGNINLKSVAA